MALRADRLSALKKLIDSDAEFTSRRLAASFGESGDPDVSFLYEAEKYSLLAGGKRVRPFLVLEFCRMFGGDPECAAPLCIAVEMMHTFSLIHDDLPCMDDDDFRRGRPSCHKQFGEAEALLAGDALSIRAFEAILTSDLDDCVKVRACLALARAAGDCGMIAGQIADMRGERERLSFDEVKKLQTQKTGEMIMLSVRLGCIAAGIPDGDERLSDAVGYASCVGRVFQVIDDVLDATSTEEEMGKSVGSDKERNKSTFMTYMTPDEARDYAARLTMDAKNFIRCYPGSETLLDFADWLLDRKK